jgi:glucan-binding YG repeat protein/subtilisin family serine protease
MAWADDVAPVSTEGIQATDAVSTYGEDADGVQSAPVAPVATTEVTPGDVAGDASDGTLDNEPEARFTTLSEAEDAGAVASVPADPNAYVGDELLVVLAGEEDQATEIASVASSISAISTEQEAIEIDLLAPEPDGATTALVELPASIPVADALLELANDTSVAFAQPNYRYALLDDAASEADAAEAVTEGLSPLQVPNDPKVTESTASGQYQWWLERVNAFDAWDRQKTDGAVTVAVIDTGINLTHEDLDGNILSNLAYDAHLKVPLTSSFGTNGDLTGHGTHVAGIIAAEANNGLLGAGVSYNAKILPIAVFYQEGSGITATTLELRNAYDHVFAYRTTANIRVINLSLGGYDAEDNDTLFHNKITQAKGYGILTVCAGGNNGDSNDSDYKVDGIPTNDNKPNYPSDYDEVISVVNVNSSNVRSSSDFNNAKDIAAPGVGIYSTAFDNNTAFTSSSGTSMATPIVSGTAALLFAKSPGLSVDEVKDILYSTATDVVYTNGSEVAGPGWDKYTGYGVVDADAALEELDAREEALAPPPSPSSGWNTNDAGYYYYYDQTAGDYLRGWHKLNGSWYYFTPETAIMKTGLLRWQNATFLLGTDGRMLTGWQKVDGNWYYFRGGDSGRAEIGWYKWDGSWFYLDPSDGHMYTGAHRIDGNWFGFRGGDSGRMLTGWQRIDGNWYYFRGGDSGRAEIGWYKWDGSWFYFDTSTAIMQTGLITWQSARFYLNPAGESGRMLTGWQKVDGNWYYFRGGDSGRAEIGWYKWDGSWFYFDTSTAIMKTGLLSWGGGKFYLNPAGESGRMLTGWIRCPEDDAWRYFRGGDSGRAMTGWYKWDGSWFLFRGTDGTQMETGLVEWDGGWFYLNPAGESGRMQTGWWGFGDGWRYFRPGDSGRAMTGTATIDGSVCYFGGDDGTILLSYGTPPLYQ